MFLQRTIIMNISITRTFVLILHALSSQTQNNICIIQCVTSIVCYDSSCDSKFSIIFRNINLISKFARLSSWSMKVEAT